MKELERYLLLGVHSGQIIWSPFSQIPKLAIFWKNRKASDFSEMDFPVIPCSTLVFVLLISLPSQALWWKFHPDRLRLTWSSVFHSADPPQSGQCEYSIAGCSWWHFPLWKRKHSSFTRFISRDLKPNPHRFHDISWSKCFHILYVMYRHVSQTWDDVSHLTFICGKLLWPNCKRYCNRSNCIKKFHISTFMADFFRFSILTKVFKTREPPGVALVNVSNG